MFTQEIAPMEIKGRKGPEVVDTDEHPRKDTKLEDMTKLKPVSRREIRLCMLSFCVES